MSVSREGVARPPSQLTFMLVEFHRTFDILCNRHPTLDVPDDVADLRRALLDEEVDELKEALAAGDLVGVADALADIAHVVAGTAVTFGIDLDLVLAEVHRSNMTKLGPGGRPVKSPAGRVLKGPGYVRPEIESLLSGQPALPVGRPSRRPS